MNVYLEYNGKDGWVIVLKSSMCTTDFDYFVHEVLSAISEKYTIDNIKHIREKDALTVTAFTLSELKNIFILSPIEMHEVGIVGKSEILSFEPDELNINFD